MFRWFRDTFGTGEYDPSPAHTNGQDVNAAAEIPSLALATYSPEAIIPFKVAQLIVSGYSIFRNGDNIKDSERIIHLSQFTLAMAQLVLAMMLLIRDETCEASDTNGICTGVKITQLFYAGVLSATFALSKYAHAQSHGGAQAQAPVQAQAEPEEVHVDVPLGQ